MNRLFINILFLILVLILSQVILFSCAGPQEIPESERKYIEGVVVEGGIRGFRMRDDSGNIMRFAAGDNVEYKPSEFHAYYGDRVGVTYYTVIKRDKDWNEALRVVLLKTKSNRIDLFFVDGIIRAAGVRRYLVYLPENDLTVAFYFKGVVKKYPKNWIPKKYSGVEIHCSEELERFTRKFICDRIHYFGEDRVIPDKTVTGVVTEILVHRSIHKAPDRFSFRLTNGNTWTIYSGGETELVPKRLKVKIGDSYSIEYYRLLMGDQSIRYVASRILAR
jgi:hypothetical protein